MHVKEAWWQVEGSVGRHQQPGLEALSLVPGQRAKGLAASTCSLLPGFPAGLI